MSRYLILIHGDEARWGALTAAERQQIDEAHRAFRTRVGASVLASGRLDASHTAITLRAHGADAPAATEGPYSESSEILGGFYVVDATDRDQAVSYAEGLAEIRHDHSWVEVWPLVDA